jgi:hypothetical protein
MLEHNEYSQSMLAEYELNNCNFDADDEDDEAYNEYMIEKKLNQMAL